MWALTIKNCPKPETEDQKSPGIQVSDCLTA